MSEAWISKQMTSKLSKQINLKFFQNKVINISPDSFLYLTSFMLHWLSTSFLYTLDKRRRFLAFIHGCPYWLNLPFRMGVFRFQDMSPGLPLKWKAFFQTRLRSFCKSKLFKWRNFYELNFLLKSGTAASVLSLLLNSCNINY